MAGALFQYRGEKILAMKNYREDYVVYFGQRVIAVIQKTKHHQYRDRRGRVSKTLTEAAYKFLRGMEAENATSIESLA